MEEADRALEDLTDRCGDLLVTRQGAIATLLMDRPAKLNAMRRRFWADVCAVFDMLQDDGRTRVAIITGAGDRAFSAGGDLAEMDGMTDLEDARRYQIEAMDAFVAVESASIIVIAAVNGLALGGGCELTLACDFAIASDDAQFGMPESRIGLVPGYGIVRAPALIGPRMTKYLIASCNTISAQRAYEIDLVQAVYPKAQLMAEAHALAQSVAIRSSTALVAGKRIVDRARDAAGIHHSIEALATLQAGPDRDEGIKALLAKRTPKFVPPARRR